MARTRKTPAQLQAEVDRIKAQIELERAKRELKKERVNFLCDAFVS